MYFGNFQYRGRRCRQHGYMILLVTLMMALVLIALSAELPRIATQLRRDREQELIHRGAQYARAVKRYYRKFGSYPVRVEQLEDTNHLRFLRKRYKDPMTGKDFRMLHFGEVTLSPKGPGMGTGPGVFPGASGTRGPDGQSMPGNNQQPTNQPMSLSQMGAKGPTFGGGPIIGVASTSEKQSLHVFNEKDHYNDWEFIYDPTTDRGALIQGPYNGPPKFGQGVIPGAMNPGQMNQGGFGQTPAPFGQQPGGQSQPPSRQP
jgi:type II secretory pathway pseudopilin PulG